MHHTPNLSWIVLTVFFVPFSGRIRPGLNGNEQKTLEWYGKKDTQSTASLFNLRGCNYTNLCRFVPQGVALQDTTGSLKPKVLKLLLPSTERTPLCSAVFTEDSLLFDEVLKQVTTLYGQSSPGGAFCAEMVSLLASVV